MASKDGRSDAGRPLRLVRADLAEVVLVCRKCSKKLDGGFGPSGDQRLAKALRRALDDRPGTSKRKGRKAISRVIEVDCLDLCPRRAIVALRADRPSDWVLVPAGAAMAEVLDTLGLAQRARREVL
jgi:predicted metal-binding protein